MAETSTLSFVKPLLDNYSVRIAAEVIALLLALRIISHLITPSKATSKEIGYRPIPQPLRLPIIKNLWKINLKEPLASIADIAKQYRDVCRIEIPGMSLVVINSHRLYDEVCDTKRFHKEPIGALGEARHGVNDSLFTAHTEEENWQIAHRVIGAMYGQMVVKDCFNEMYDMTCVLTGLWSKLSPQDVINPYAEFSKFAVDTIAHIAMDLEINSMLGNEVPQFAHDMTAFMSESGKRSLRPAWMSKYIFRSRDRRYWSSIRGIRSLGEEALKKRLANGKNKQDVLDAMINNPDPITGKKMTETSIIDNAVTLLGAGYESIASMLSWSLILFLKHPKCLQILRDEIDGVLGDRQINASDVDKLQYLQACIREASRLYPGAYAHSVKLRADADESLGGLGEENFLVKRGDTIRINLLSIQRDPLVYGDDAEEFKPERMLEEEFKKLPRNAWKPFGNGNRICIGRFFALQEAVIVLTTLLQKFDFEMVDDRCRCHIGETLILVPLDCTMRVKKRQRTAPLE